MLPRIVLVAAAIASLALSLLAFAGPTVRWRFDRAEDARLHAHFARVIAEIAARPMLQLAPAARAERAHLLALLGEYDRAGRFPRNEGQSAARTPIFVDRHGTRCAMAWLIEHTGGREFVARIARTANLAYIPDLAGDPELQRWLAGAGLDLAEAARIQPTYGPPPLVPSAAAEREDHVPDDDMMNTATTIAVVFGAPAIFLNLNPNVPRAERLQHAVFAMLVGGASAGMGVTDGLHDRHLRPTGYAQLVIGGTAMALGLLDLREPRSGIAASRTDSRARLAMRSGLMGEPQVALALRF
jgi:hypothetical protein